MTDMTVLGTTADPMRIPAVGLPAKKAALVPAWVHPHVEHTLPDWIDPPFWIDPWATPLAMVRPLMVFRSLEGEEWRVALGIVGGAALARTTLYLLFGIGSDMTNKQIAFGTFYTVLYPALYIGALFGLMSLLLLARKRFSFGRALSLATIASGPIALRYALQAIMTPILQRTMFPKGLPGLFFAPHDAPHIILRVLGTVDLWGIWSVILVVVAGTVALTARPAASLSEPLSQPSPHPAPSPAQSAVATATYSEVAS